VDPGHRAPGPARGAPLSERAALAAIGGVSAAVIVGVAVLLLGRAPAPHGGADVSALPALNATLNATSAALLVLGYGFIRRRWITGHLTAMLAAFGVSALFLASYVIYHYHAGSRPFGGQGWVRPVYFGLLITHIVLAAAIVPLALTTIWQALTGRFARHRRLARWTLPLWLYVSVTGVIIYWMLYRV
jgi:putative membrane protein